MESSTTLPTATVSPESVRMLMVRPKRPKVAMAIISESGMLMAATSVVRTLRRKTKMTRTAKSPPSRPSCRRPSTDSVMNSAWSVMVSMTMTSGWASRASSNTASTSLESWTVLAPDDFETLSVSDGCPLVRA